MRAESTTVTTAGATERKVRCERSSNVSALLDAKTSEPITRPWLCSLVRYSAFQLLA